MSMVQWENDSKRGTPKHSKNLPQCPSLHQKSHTNWPGIEH